MRGAPRDIARIAVPQPRSAPPIRRSCAAAAPARTAAARAARHPRRRQGGRLDDRSRGTALLPNAAAEPARRHCRHPPRLRPADPSISRSSRPAIRCRTRPASRRPSATLALADAVDADDLVLVLLSGGASANWIAPAHGLTLEEKQAVTRALLTSGANIGEMNAVRKHLSRIKGGRLAQRAYPAKSGDARDFRRAGRRPGGDRLRADGARSDDACRRARDRLPLPARTARQP